jgi:hypothetical protein
MNTNFITYGNETGGWRLASQETPRKIFPRGLEKNKTYAET